MVIQIYFPWITSLLDQGHFLGGDWKGTCPLLNIHSTPLCTLLCYCQKRRANFIDITAIMLYISLPQKIPQYAPVWWLLENGGRGWREWKLPLTQKKLIVQKIPQYAHDWLLYGGGGRRKAIFLPPPPPQKKIILIVHLNLINQKHYKLRIA